MKGMKGKLLKKLKSVKQISYLNPDRILQVSALDGIVDNFPLKSNFVDNFPFKSHNKSNSYPRPKPTSLPKLDKSEVIDVEKLMKELEEEEEEEQEKEEESKKINPKNDIDEKENISPSIISEDPELKEQRNSEIEVESCTRPDKEEERDSEIEKSSSCYKEINVSSFRRPDMDSGSLFDPKLLAAFEEAVKEHIRNMKSAELETSTKNHKYPFFQPEDQTDPLTEFDNQSNPLTEFEEKSPPGGSDSVIFYTTSLRGIRKTFEDCQSIRFLLESFGLIFYERDVSIHSDYRDELWRIMGERCLPPKLFIRGRYIGGAEQVLTLHEQGRLRPLFRDIPINFSEGPCNVCCGLRFILCYNCNGSRKLYEHDDPEGSHGGLWNKCSQCNENGLIVCPLC